MSQASQAVWFNAVPLLVLAALYLAVTFGLTPAFVRQRQGASALDWAHYLLFPAIGIPAAIFGGQILHDHEPIGGQVWPPFVAILIALVPAVLFLVRWSDRALIAAGLRRAREAERRVSAWERELEAVEAISKALARAGDAEAVARVLLDEIAGLFDVNFAGLALVDEEAREARGLLARRDGVDFDYWREVRFDLQHEPSGVASAVFEAAPVTFYDVAGSPQINQQVAEAVGAKSAAFIPLVTGERVIAVLAVASTEELRPFSTEELGPMRALAAEAALGLERARSAAALSRALERERLVASIARKVRSELDLDAVQRVAVEEIARALGVERCFIRLGEPGEPMPMAAEWFADGLAPIGEAAERLPVSNLAARRRQTVAIGDIETAPELDDRTLGGRETLIALGTRAVLATPIVVFDRMIGVFALHRTSSTAWTQAEISLAEAVARELGLAIHTARLLRENEIRLGQQAALLAAAQVVTSELRLETVLQRLVDEVTELLAADAADCYLYDPARETLRCAAVHGLDPGVLGFEFAPARRLAGRAIEEGPVLARAYGSLRDPVPHPAYEGFAQAIVAPMTWSGETRGVLGVGSRDPKRLFSHSDVEMLAAFATLASLALRNAELFEQRERQARIERGFTRIASVLGEPVSLSETIDAVAQAAGEALGGSFEAVLMPRGRSLALAGSHDLPPALSEALAAGLPESAATLADAARAGRVLSAPQLAGDERFGAEWEELAAAAGFRSLLAIPVDPPRDADGGLVVVFFTGERTTTDDDLELARQVATAAKGALERSELFETERRARALSQRLARSGRQLTAELDPTAVLEEVVEQAPALLRVDGCSVRVLEGEELVLRAAVGRGAEELLDSRVPTSSRLPGEVVQTRAPVALADVSADQRLLEGEPLLARGFRAYLGVPLHGAEAELHGVLAVYASAPREWREEEIEALSALAGNASVALSNAELYQRVELERERSARILENIADGIVAVDRDGNVVLWNKAAEAITGVPAEEALGRTTARVLQRSLESEAGAGGVPRQRLVRIRRGNDELTLSLTEAVMRDPAGAIAGRIFAFRDVSSERAVEQMKSDFVATVSHALRTPLTSIYGFAETMLRQDIPFSDEERRTFLSYVASEAERLTTIVDQLLSVARLDAGDLEVQVAPTDVRSVVSDVVARLGGGPTVDGLSFVVDLPDDPVDAQVDADKLRQILANLVDNAVKFSPSGGTVTVAAERLGDTVVVRVSDEGAGIPEMEQERIFTKFYRAEPSVRGAGGGTGLGLFIAQGLVTAMGGRIRVRSAEGEGSSFIVELPAVGAPALSEGQGVPS